MGYDKWPIKVNVFHGVISFIYIWSNMCTICEESILKQNLKEKEKVIFFLYFIYINNPVKVSTWMNLLLIHTSNWITNMTYPIALTIYSVVWHRKMIIQSIQVCFIAKQSILSTNILISWRKMPEINVI